MKRGSFAADALGHRIRPGTAEDLTAIERIVRDAYAKYVERIDKPPAPMLDDYRQRIRDHAAWVLEQGDDVVAVLVLLPEADHLLLDNIAVDPEQQGEGLGRALMDFAEMEARRRGYDEIRLYTHRTMTENIALYPRLGYEETGRGAQAGYERVFFRKRLSSPPSA